MQHQFSLLLGLLLAVIAGACGKVGEPLPPLSSIPRAILDLEVRQQGQEMTLSWTMPQFNVDGSVATTVSFINVFRVISHQNNSPPDFSLAKFDNPWRTLHSREFNDQNDEGKIVLRDSLEDLQPEEIDGREVSYVIEVFNNKHKSSGFSNFVTLPIFLVPLPPKKLQFRLNERFIEVRWTPSEKSLDGSKTMYDVKFNLYNSLQAGVYGSVPINPIPLSESYFRDRSTSLGKKTYYKVRAVVQTSQGLIESQDSEEASVINNDIYPPIVPQQLTIISTQTSLNLVWFPNSEMDLDGYHIYRKENNSSFTRITSDLVRQTSFSDESVRKGMNYSYSVTAIDQSKNESSYSEVVTDAIE